MTRAYHIVQFQDGSAYSIFYGCKWHCSYCIWSFEKWNLCLPSETKKDLQLLWDNGKVKFLSIERFSEILKSNSVKLVFMGGGEPTEDPEIKSLVSKLKKDGIKSWIITNGENLDDELFSMVNGLTLSLKALDDELHKKITGFSNKNVIEKIKYFKAEKMTIETVYVRDLVECNEIIRIAEFLKGINPQVRLRIDPVIGKLHKDEDYDRIKACLEIANKFIYTSMIKPSGNLRPSSPKLLYPNLK